MELDFNKMGGLVPAIIQDNTTKKVLMLGFMNQEALDKTIETGKLLQPHQEPPLDKGRGKRKLPQRSFNQGRL